MKVFYVMRICPKEIKFIWLRNDVIIRGWYVYEYLRDKLFLIPLHSNCLPNISPGKNQNTYSKLMFNNWNSYAIFFFHVTERWLPEWDTIAEICLHHYRHKILQYCSRYLGNFHFTERKDIRTTQKLHIIYKIFFLYFTDP